MRSCFFSATESRERRLRSAGIPFELFQIEGQRGLVIEECHLGQALGELGLVIESHEQSQYDGIIMLQVRRGRNGLVAIPVMVTVEGWSNESNDRIKEEFSMIAKEFSSLFGVNEIVLFDSRTGERGQPPRDEAGKFTIFFWSAAQGRSHDADSGDRQSASHLWGHKISERRGHWRIWYPSGRGLIIKDPEGADVAELVGGNLYIYYPITMSAISRGADIFRHILQEALVLYGVSSEELAERLHAEEEARLEQLRAEARACPVSVKKWSSSREMRERFVAVAHEFTERLEGRPILIYDYCDGAEKHAPSTDGRVHICIWSSSDDLSGDGNMQRVLFGEHLEWEDENTILKPSGDMGVLITDEDYNQVGKMVDNTIYVHYPLLKREVRLKWGGKGPEELFRRILQEAVFLRTATEDEKAARARLIAQGRRSYSRERYVEVCKHRLDKVVQQDKETIERNPDKVRGHQRGIIKLLREAREAARRLERTEADQAQAAVQYAQEFDKLFEVQKIRDVRAIDGTINVFTEVLYCIDPRSKRCHEIGAFRIELNLDGDVRWFNLTRKVDGLKTKMNAPHVWSNGNACLGNMDEVIPQLIADYELAALAMICIQFIENVNTDDVAGAYIDRWPVVD